MKYLVEFHIDNVDRRVEFDTMPEAELYYQMMCERNGIKSVKLIGAGGGIIRQNGRVYGN